MLSAFAVSFFVIRGLEVFDESQIMKLKELQDERDLAQKITLQTQIDAKETAERWTEALVNINRQISNLEHVDEILINIGKSARRLLNSDFLGIALLDDENNELILNYYSTANNTEVVQDHIPVQNSIIQNVVQEKQHYFSQFLEPTEKMANSCFLDDVDSGTIACVYLNFDNRPIGAIWVARTTGVTYKEEDLIWLECMADQVVIAIQHGIMTSQMQSISVSEERARIAREMHDGLAQVLGYLNLQVQTIEALHKTGKNELLEKELKHMRQAIQAAHGDVRENILSLRTTLANKKGVLQAIEEYLQEFGIQTGITTNLQIQSDCDLTLSSIAEVQLVCILQEALANVRKHSQAKSVDVKIGLKNNQDEAYIQMQVFDNGMGFIVQDSKRRFGLKTMQERANSVNGILEIDSKLGEGTKVICRIPCLDQETITTKDGYLTGNSSNSVIWNNKT
jgi:signal transduction histidine kinase